MEETQEKIKTSVKLSIYMTQTCTIHPILAALIALEKDVLHKTGTLEAVNIMQERLLQLFEECREDPSKFLAQELMTRVSKEASILNAFLREHDFFIQLQPLADNDVGIVSIMKWAAEWGKKGEIADDVINYQGQSYRGARLKSSEGFGFLLFYTLPNYSNLIVQIKTKSGDAVFLTVADKPLAGFDLLNKIETLRMTDSNRKIMSFASEFNRIVFPMINLDHEVDISWMKDMKATDNQRFPWKIVQALQQTKVKMNEVGAKVESAVAIVARCLGAEPITKELVIDQPFFMWVERSGMKRPLFTGYIAPDCWRDPGRTL